jgi:hypothetical protein
MNSHGSEVLENLNPKVQHRELYDNDMTIRIPTPLAREFKAKTKAAKTNPSAILRRAAADYVRLAAKARTSPNAALHPIRQAISNWPGIPRRRRASPVHNFFPQAASPARK